MKQSQAEARVEHKRRWLREEAINSLPPHIREAALVPDQTPLPMGLRNPKYNRPAHNFHEVYAERTKPVEED